MDIEELKEENAGNGGADGKHLRENDPGERERRAKSAACGEHVGRQLEQFQLYGGVFRFWCIGK